MKLVPARCPQCGADLEVNQELEKAICQYCGTTILVEDAIQRVKIVGKIQIESENDKQLQRAEKKIEIGEYSDASDILDSIINDDDLNIEAYKLRIILNIKRYNNITESDFYDRSLKYKYSCIILSDYNRINKLNKKQAEYVLNDYPIISELYKNKE